MRKTKIIWMSDPHFQKDGTVGGIDPRMRLTAAIEHANTYHADADLLLLSGDLAGHAGEDYDALAGVLAKANIPVHPMMGNHDERGAMRQYLSLPAKGMEDFIQYSVETPDKTIICLDTHKIGSHAGEICAARLG